MPENYIHDWLRGTGIKDQRHLRDRSIAALVNWDQALQGAIDAGGIDREFGEAAQRSLARKYMHEISESPELWRIYQKKNEHGRSEWDTLVERADGYSDDRDESPEAAQKREDDALKVCMEVELADRFAKGNISSQDAFTILSDLDPAAIDEGRKRAGFNQVKEGDLDGTLRDLTEDEKGTVAAVGWYHHQGLTTEQPQREPDAAPAEPAARPGDFDIDMNAYAARREREDANHLPSVGQSDGVYQTKVED